MALCLGVALSLVGCGKKEEPAPTPAAPAPAAAPEAAVPEVPAVPPPAAPEAPAVPPPAAPGPVAPAAPAVDPNQHAAAAFPKIHEMIDANRFKEASAALAEIEAYGDKLTNANTIQAKAIRDEINEKKLPD
ncbi:MAG: hypothetical protein NTW19_08610 [Planctomycetota bacterium]|nr:hypothetical protein [Planctomycetota bacterium]